MSRRLLIADDEAGVRALVRMTLQSDRYEIVEAENGEQALRLARTLRPDLVLLDVAMPGADGFDVCKALKADPATAHAVVVMLTAHAQDADRERGRAAGANDYFTKPFSPVALLRMVDDVFSGGSPT